MLSMPWLARGLADWLAVWLSGLLTNRLTYTEYMRKAIRACVIRNQHDTRGGSFKMRKIIS